MLFKEKKVVSKLIFKTYKYVFFVFFISFIDFCFGTTLFYFTIKLK
ncbi:hypothetical protein CPF_0651 [Clostridium perfringens ATCC 13124]|uniref:Uncharacterized protein n=1 Tax=Clostridium perfringens (strain ATCC 13124 / DSM 756 / JCM 1290 / NCIMB 6125 / NCTC 8237 / Type A) TaxID=195103 RepID=A0A0H2YTJ1_CLOP1|nr:hypothetical protein CPF_0651 [Clostridium perfringens ATCC 13124]